MSLFLLYFDDGPLDNLDGHLGHGMVFVCFPLRLSHNGSPLTSQGLAINYQCEGHHFRSAFDPIHHRELFRFIAARQAAGWVPHLLFHWEQTSNDAIDSAQLVDASVNTPEDLFSILHQLPNDVLVRLTVPDPPQISLPDLLDERLAEGDCPWLDGIIFGDGAIILVSHQKDPEPQYLPTVRPLLRSTLAAFWEYNAHAWATATLLAPIPLEAAGVQVILGEVEPPYDSTGFMVVRGLQDGKVRWAAQLDDSGRFTDPLVQGGELVVTAAQTGLKWCFPLARPERVRVERPGPRQR